ncbi:MAG: AAA family ATPase [Spirochaetaceae bacterium]|nr:AAA family ATPase [Spirochaetaceae bacterium]
MQISTLIRRELPGDAYIFNLADPAERAAFSAHPEELIRICRSMPKREEPWFVFIDEAQTVPDIFNAVQVLFDEDRESRRIILCGSSARKLRTSGANLLPGRSIQYSLFPLTSPEYLSIGIEGFPVASVLAQGSLIPALRASEPETGRTVAVESFPFRSLEDRLLFGDLPGIAATESPSERRDVLKTYVTAHLEEEIRRETALREWGAFLRFLAFAAAESGSVLNLKAISRESGLSAPTIRSHYQLLEDMFLGFMLPAFSGSPRKSVLSSPLFEQWVGIELYKRLRYLGEGRVCYFRTSGGAEVDFIVERGGRLSPIEVKWTEHPGLSDARHLLSFMKDHPDKSDHGYVVCRCKYPQALAQNITAIPWWGL